MKVHFWERILLFIYAIVGLLAALYFALQAFGVKVVSEPLNWYLSNVPGDMLATLLTAAAALLISLHMFSLGARRKKNHRRAGGDFITIENAQVGTVQVAMSAINELVNQAVAKINGLKCNSVTVEGDTDAINIAMDATISGMHIPNSAAAIQQTIRSYVEKNSGIVVRNVKIFVSGIITGSAPAVTYTEPKTESAVPTAETRSEPVIQEPEEVPSEAQPEDEVQEPEQPSFVFNPEKNESESVPALASFAVVEPEEPEKAAEADEAEAVAKPEEVESVGVAETAASEPSENPEE